MWVAREKYEALKREAMRRIESWKRQEKQVKKEAKRMVAKAKKGQMKAEDDNVVMSLALERNFDPFSVLWWWEAVICTVGPLVIMSIFVGGAWHKGYT